MCDVKYNMNGHFENSNMCMFMNSYNNFKQTSEKRFKIIIRMFNEMSKGKKQFERK